MTSLLKGFNFQDINSSYLDLISQFRENKFEIIQQLTDALLSQEYENHYSQISSILISLLIKECSKDNFMLQKIFSSIFSDYIATDSSLKHLQTLYVLNTYFNKQISIEGDTLIRYFLSKNAPEQCLRVLIFLSQILKKRENQKNSFNLSDQHDNFQQPSLVQLKEPSRLIDELIKICNKTLGKKGALIAEQIDDQTALSMNCLLFLRKQMSKQQLSKLSKILFQNLKNIEIVCLYNFESICSYLQFLQQNLLDFINPSQHKKILDLIKSMNDAYFQNVEIQYGKVKMDTKKEIYLLVDDDRLEQVKFLQSKISSLIEQIYNLEDGIEVKYLDRKIFEEKTQYFQLYQQITLELVQFILTEETFGQLVLKQRDVYLELLIQSFKLGFFEQLPTADICPFNDEVYLKLEEVLELITVFINENKILAYINKELNSIEKRCSMIKKSEILNKNLQFQTDYSYNQIQDDILVVDKSDKFQFIACLQTMSHIFSKELELKDIDVFFKYFSYILFDPFLYNYASRVSAQLVISFKQYTFLYHMYLIPQLIESFKIDDSQMRIFALDVFLNIFSQIQKQHQAQLYPYVKDLLHILIKEYNYENFFKYSSVLTEGLQSLIKQLLDLEDIEQYLEDEIQKIEQQFLEMIADQEKREFMIQKNHQVCLCALLKVKQKLSLDCSQLTDNIKSMAEEVAQKFLISKNELTTRQKALYYKFFKILNIEILGSQECFNLIFLKILPVALQDGSVKNCPIQIKYRNLESLNPEIDVESDDYQMGENEEDFENEEVGVNQYAVAAAQAGPAAPINNQNFVNLNIFQQQIIEEEEEEEEREQLIYEPSFEEQNFVEEALNVIQTFCTESTELFLDYKKFDVFNLIVQNLQNELIFERSTHFIFEKIQQIMGVTQKYYLKKYQEEIEQKGESQILNQGAIEIFQMFHLAAYKTIQFDDSKSEEYYTFLTISIQNMIKALDQKIVEILIDQLYDFLIRMVLLLTRQYKVLLINGLNLLVGLLSKMPEIAVQKIKTPYLILQGLLRHRIIYQNPVSYQDIYEQEILKRPIFADCDSVEICLIGLNDFFQINPQVYTVINQLYFEILVDEKYINRLAIGIAINNFLTKIARYCHNLITSEQKLIILQLIYKFQTKQKSQVPDYQQFIISFTIAKVMISLQQIEGLNIKDEIKNENLKKLLQILPKITENCQYEDVKYILENIKKFNYILSSQENDNIEKFLFRIQVI